MSDLSSAYVPVISPPESVPDFIDLDRASEWDTTALLVAAVETMTLPARLRGPPELHRSLADLEAVLNVNGNQKVHQLQCKIGSDNDPPNLLPANGQTQITASQRMDRSDHEHDPRASNSTKSSSPTYFDVDFSVDGMEKAQPAKYTHIFGQVEVGRGADLRQKNDSPTQEQDIAGRQARRFGSEPFVERSVCPVPLLLLSTERW